VLPSLFWVGGSHDSVAVVCEIFDEPLLHEERIRQDIRAIMHVLTNVLHVLIVIYLFILFINNAIICSDQIKCQEVISTPAIFSLIMV